MRREGYNPASQFLYLEPAPRVFSVCPLYYHMHSTLAVGVLQQLEQEWRPALHIEGPFSRNQQGSTRYVEQHTQQ